MKALALSRTSTKSCTTDDLYKHEWFPIFTVLILLGGLTKSAQFPFHFWLPGAMSAPTPSERLFTQRDHG